MYAKDIPPKRCDKCGRYWADCLVRECPHPKVRELIGEQMCLYCCRKCKHAVKLPYGALGCELFQLPEKPKRESKKKGGAEQSIQKLTLSAL